MIWGLEVGGGGWGGNASSTLKKQNNLSIDKRTRREVTGVERERDARALFLWLVSGMVCLVVATVRAQ